MEGGRRHTLKSGSSLLRLYDARQQFFLAWKSSLVWDGAGFHTRGGIRVPTNLSLIRLPAYSPEHNPIENLWHYPRSHYWSNRKYADHAAFETAAILAGGSQLVVTVGAELPNWQHRSPDWPPLSEEIEV